MQFLSKKLMQKKTKELSVVPHPLLSLMEMSLRGKMIYLQGCVLGALLDDAKVSEDERQQIQRIGLSLGLSSDEIDESLSSVEGLKSDEDKEAFIDELKSGVGEFPVSKYFLADFEEVMKKDGTVPAASKEFLDFIGAQITGKEDWRKALNSAAKQKAKKKNSVAPEDKKASASTEKIARKETKASSPTEDSDEPSYGFGDQVWRTNPEHNGIECSFEGKPSESVRSKLKAAGFRFSGKQGLWYAKDSEKTRKAMRALGLTCVDDEDEPTVETQDEGPINVRELIDLIENSNIDVTIEDEDECQPRIKSAEISTAWRDNECTLKITWGFPEEGTAGKIVFEVAGVKFSADRNFDGEHDSFEITGREIDYDDDELDEDSVLEAVESNVSMTEFDPDDYPFEEENVDASDVTEVLDDQPNCFAVDDSDTVYGYDDEDEVDEDYEVIDVDDAVEKMLKEGSQVEFEQE